MVIKADTKHKLKRLVKRLDSVKGRGTELISVYVPHDYDLNEIVAQLREEEGEAENIKSKRTRKNVQSALSKMVDHLKQYERTPDNGLAVFCGDVSEREGRTDVELWDIEPPEPLQIKLYRCDKEFKLDPLKEMREEKADYGLLVMDTNDADIGILKGKRVVQKKHISSLVPGKSKPGGQSAARYDRVREGLLEDYLKNVGEATDKVLDADELEGVLVGGPGMIKDRFVKEGYLPYELEDSVVAVQNTSYTGEQGFEELLKKSREQLKETELQKEKELVKEMFDRLREDGKVTYGAEQVIRAIELGAVETVLLSEDLDMKGGKVKCECGNMEDVIVEDGETVTCGECGQEVDPKEQINIYDYMEEKAQQTGAEVEIVSSDTREGAQLYEMGGIAALLRFKVS